MGYLDDLKAYLKGSRTDLLPESRHFPRVDLSSIRNQQRLDELAQDNGAADLPPTDSTILDGVERGITGDFEAVLNRYVETLQEQVSSYQTRVGGYINEVNLQQIDTEMRVHDSDMEAEIEKITNKIYEPIENKLKNSRNEIINFRQEHNLVSRLPVPSDTFRCAAIMLIMLVLEVSLSFFLLEEEKDTTAFSLSIFYCLINLGGAFGLGYFYRYTNHISGFKKAGGWIAGLIWFFLVAFGVNFLIGHYRAVVMKDAANQLQAEIAGNTSAFLQSIDYGARAFEAFIQNPIALPDVLAWLLTLLGIICSVLAVREGYRIDDPYPGYGRLHRRWNEDFNNYVSDINNGIQELQRLQHDGIDMVEDLKTEFTDMFKLIPELIRHAEQTRVDCLNAIDLCNSDMKQLIQEYRDANQRHRKTPPPTYFQRAPDSLEKDVPELPIFENLEIEEDINQTLTDYSDRINNRFNELKKNLETTRQAMSNESPFKVEVTSNG